MTDAPVVGIDAGGTKTGGAFEQVPALGKHTRMELLALLPRAAVEAVREEPAMGAARLAARLAWG